MRKRVDQLTLPKGAYLQLYEAKSLLKTNQRAKAFTILQTSVDMYPEAYQIRVELAFLAMRKKEWETAIINWSTLWEIGRVQRNPLMWANYGRALRIHEELEEAFKVLQEGLAVFPNNKQLQFQYVLVLGALKKWPDVIATGEHYLQAQNPAPAAMYKQTAVAHQECASPKKAITTLRQGLKIYPKHNALWMGYAMLKTMEKEWEKALSIWKHMQDMLQEKASLETYLYPAMLHHILGNQEEAVANYAMTYNRFPKQLKKDKLGYRKVVLFDNGESRIEFYRKTSQTDTLVLTFDSINMTWDEPPFAFKLLAKKDVDIIAVRKRESGTYQQDMSREEFYETVKHIVAFYKHKIAYGFSLGGYTSLYYASTIKNCRILAISPRVSVHPVYGKPKIQKEYSFHHEQPHPGNHELAPIIVFDPKNKLDNRYITEELFPAYPRAVFIKIPYGGHRLAPHLLEMGKLKCFIETVITSKEVPVYEPHLRKQSSVYYRILATECLKRNKLRWAISLIDSALTIKPKDVASKRLRNKILRSMHKQEKYTSVNE